ncbi:MAG: hypothetical protein HZB17_10450 [Chloroflexi bacterium]|nr:hypothetical protein [Chloroflexota bacterium]
MPLSDYIRILWRRGWILILVAALTAASAFVFSRLQTPIYKSTIYLLVQPARTDFGLTQSAKILLRSYVAWMDTDNRAAAVIDALQLDRTPQDLRGDVTIASDDSRFVIQIDMKNRNGDLANDIAKKWAELFIQWRNDENQKLDQPKTAINVAAGAILGLLLGGVLVFVLESIESSVIRSAMDIERQFSLPVFGSIPASEKKSH